MDYERLWIMRGKKLIIYYSAPAPLKSLYMGYVPLTRAMGCEGFDYRDKELWRGPRGLR